MVAGWQTNWSREPTANKEDSEEFTKAAAVSVREKEECEKRGR